MAVRPVLTLPQEVLKVKAGSMRDDDHSQLIEDLLDTMRASPACVGLAAPQIGRSVRAFVVDVSKHPKTTVNHGLIAMVDPVVIQVSGREIGREGCMSVPDLTANVARATRIVVRGRSPEGNDVLISTEGFEARALQHEIDHLDGMLILDRVTSLQTDVFRRKVYR
jgi:peptide deformylase